ncbi:MAG: DUF3108 domain-containing protein [Kiritimatiellia bacterium]
MMVHERLSDTLRRICCLLVSVGLLVLVPVARADDVADQIRTLGFPVGEELVYQIHWGIVPVAEAVVTTAWQEGAEGELLVLRLRVRSNRAIAAIYPVSIDLESIVRMDGFRPLRHTQNRREGRRRSRLEVIFDYAGETATIRSIHRGREKSVPLEPGVRDVFTSLYYMRRYPFELGAKTHYRVLSDRNIYDLWLQTGNREVRVSSLNDQKVAAVAIEPEASVDDLFVHEGRPEIYVSRGARQLMLRMQVRVPIGSIRAVLSEVRGPAADIWDTREGED